MKGNEHPRLGTLRNTVAICGVPVKTFEAALQHGKSTRGGCHVESDQICVHLRRPVALLVVSMRAVRWWASVAAAAVFTPSSGTGFGVDHHS